MLSRPEPACLLIADISGYTSYLAGAELDHAQDILADLMTTVVGALRPGFRLAKLEGDAAFVYVLTERIDGSQLLDTVERTYFAFRRRLRDIAQATSCACNACVLMPRLDLKVIAHHGSIIRHKVAGREELVGSDVIVAHRFLKNHVVERLGMPAYAMFSDACMAAMGVDPVALGMTEYRDTYDDLGEVGAWVHDLGAAWAAELERRRKVVTEREPGFVFESIQPAPRDIVWSFLTDPSIRPRWQAGVTGVERVADRAPSRGRHDQPLHARRRHDRRGDPRLAPDGLRDPPLDDVERLQGHVFVRPGGRARRDAGPGPVHVGQEQARAR